MRYLSLRGYYTTVAPKDMKADIVEAKLPFKPSWDGNHMVRMSST